MAYIGAEEAEASRDAALRKVDETRQQRGRYQADQQRQDAVKSVIGQWQQVGLPVADPAPVTHRTLTPVPVAVTPPPLPYEVSAHWFSGGSPAEVPLPKRSSFSSTGPWEAFIRPLSSLAQTCRWSEEEKVVCLSNSLRGDATEYAFCQLTPDVNSS